jgi:phage shock protein PspC (stress-responsive transcriptional regulator)
MKNRLYRSKDKLVGGVCGGLGEYLNIDPTIVRIAFGFLLLFAGCGLLAYLLGWIIIPEDPSV